MHKMTISGAFFGCLLTTAVSLPVAAQSPDTALVNGKIITLDERSTIAEALAVRDGAIIYTSKLSSLKRFKDDASEVRTGFECGAGIANFNDVKVGDILECFQVMKLSAADAAAQSSAPASRR